MNVVEGLGRRLPPRAPARTEPQPDRQGDLGGDSGKEHQARSNASSDRPASPGPRRDNQTAGQRSADNANVQRFGQPVLRLGDEDGATSSEETQPRPLAATEVDQTVARIKELNAQIIGAPPSYQSFLMHNREVVQQDLNRDVRSEIELLHAGRPGAGTGSTAGETLSAAEAARLGEQIVDRHADDPVAQREVRIAVDKTVIDIEVETAVAAVDAAETPEQKLEQLNEQIDSISPDAQTLVLDHASARQVFDDLAVSATAPIAERGEELPLHQVVMDTVWNLDALLTPDVNPQLAAQILQRTQPAFDIVIEEYDQAIAEENFDVPFGLLDPMSLEAVGRLAERVVGAPSEGQTITDLAKLGSYGDFIVNAGGGLPHIDSPARMELAIEIARLNANDTSNEPSIDPGASVSALIDNYQAYVEEGPLADSIQAYTEHTEELAYYIASFPEGLPPEKLQEAIAEYVENEGDTWKNDLAALEKDVAMHSANALRMREQLADLPPELAASQGDLTTRVGEIVGSDNFVIAASITADSHPELLENIDIEAALGFVDAFGLGANGAKLTKKLADSYVQHTVSSAIGKVDPNDPASIAKARGAIDSLRTESFANAWGVEGELDDLNKALDALDDTLPDGSAISVDAAGQKFATYEDELEGITSFEADTPLGFAFRSLGLATSLTGAIGSTTELLKNPSLETAAEALVSDIGLVQTGTQFADDLGLLVDDSALARGFGNATLGKVLGTAGLAFGTIGSIRSFSDGDWQQGSLGAASVAGGALATFGTASWAGPVGVAITVAAAGISLGVDQYRNIRESNECTGAEAVAFLKHAGLDTEAATSLADRSAERHNALPALIAYGSAHGLTEEQTIDWINSLPPSDVDFVRDRFHRLVDKTDGTVNDFPYSNHGDEFIVQQSPGNQNSMHLGVPTSVVVADAILNDSGVPLPTA